MTPQQKADQLVDKHKEITTLPYDDKSWLRDAIEHSLITVEQIQTITKPHVKGKVKECHEEYWSEVIYYLYLMQEEL